MYMLFNDMFGYKYDGEGMILFLTKLFDLYANLKTTAMAAAVAIFTHIGPPRSLPVPGLDNPVQSTGCSNV